MPPEKSLRKEHGVTALDEIRGRVAECKDGFSSDPGAYIRSAGDVPRLLAAAEEILRLHRMQEQPVISWDHVCNAHRSKPGISTPGRGREARNCPDCVFSELYVCAHCACPNDMWPCPTYRAVLAALTGTES